MKLLIFNYFSSTKMVTSCVSSLKYVLLLLWNTFLLKIPNKNFIFSKVKNDLSVTFKERSINNSKAENYSEKDMASVRHSIVNSKFFWKNLLNILTVLLPLLFVILFAENFTRFSFTQDEDDMGKESSPVLGEGGDSGGLIPGKSLAFATWSCWCSF